MITKLATKCTFILQNNGVQMQDAEDREVYEYGLKLIFLYIIDITILLLVSLFVGRFWESVMILTIFACMQAVGGGYHANSALICFGWTMSGLATCLILTSLISNRIPLVLTIAFVSMCVILALTPVNNRRSVKNNENYKKFKVLSKLLTILLFFFSCTFILFRVNFIAAIFSVSLLVYAFSVSAAKIAKARAAKSL